MGPLRHGLRRLTFDRFGAFGRRVLRTDNASLPHLQNKVIAGRVESRNEDGFYTVDIGFKAPSMFHEKELRRGVGTKLKEEPLPEIGDRLELYVRYLQNPMGEMEVSSADGVRAARSEGAWREIMRHYRMGTHVKGRVLNPVNGGYAVGIAGLVAFLPNQCVRPHRGSPEPPAGELLPFKILGVTESIKNVILVGPMTGGGGSRRDGRGPAPWAGRGAARKERGARTGDADEKGGDARDARRTDTPRGAFWKRKKLEARDAGASMWVKLSGSERSGGARGAPKRELGSGPGEKETAPPEKTAGDGRPTRGGDGNRREA